MPADLDSEADFTDESNEESEDSEIAPQTTSLKRKKSTTEQFEDEEDNELSPPPCQKPKGGSKKILLDASDSEDNDPKVAEPASKPKRKAKVLAKQAEIDEANMRDKMKKLDKLQKEVTRYKSNRKKSNGKENLPPGQHSNVESEEETVPPGQKISSSIQISSTATTPLTSHARAPLKRVGAAAAHMPSSLPKISSNAFRSLPAPPPGAGNTDEMSTPSDMQVSSDLSSAVSSPCVTHIQTTLAQCEASGTATAESSPLAALPATVADMLRQGAQATPRKPKAADYTDVVHALIIRAAAKYKSLVATKGAFPDTATRNKWARLSWKNAGLAADESYPLLDSINLLLRNRGSQIRGHVITNIRPLLISHLGFNRSSAESIIAANIALVKALKTNTAFHYKDLLTLTGFCQGKVISEALNAVWFDEKKAHGIVFKSLFNPIPLETLALIMTVIDFALDEWSTGSRIKAVLWEKEVVDRHWIFRKDLEEWNKLNEKVVLGLRKKLYLRAS
ncbi:hypothetical protein HYPSUDRAFT_57685 [Hypholoma sublateritium FD-334 SS-4]|uniref:DUF6532 domain-containing protein n=1 Tax=Hypholoma sublateritium (strain FD-334 SS-4) TaxID=945553 RepID=A0A0D2NEU9_HYPSF|nr:hypothetical protein HYPSUDRAFT_57685 [Hypholoma sublateritium FD-334 SS-4]